MPAPELQIGNRTAYFRKAIRTPDFGSEFFDMLWNLAMPLAAMVGLFTLIFTVPVMLLKQASGEFTTK